MKKEISIFWFRRDLRIDDNKGLYYALKDNDSVLPIFIYDKNILDKLKKIDHRIDYINYSISEINNSLSKKNKSISSFYGYPKEVFSKLINKFDVKKVYVNRDYTPYSIKRDLVIQKLLENNKIQFCDFKDHVLFEKNEIVKDDGTPYKVYTPFSKKWINKMNEQGVASYPSENLIDKLLINNNEFETKSIGFTKSEIKYLKSDTSNEIIKNYESKRNFPSFNGTSKAGVQLRFGTISTRKLITKACKSNNNTFLKELIWREFFQQILYHFPKTVTESFKPKYERIEWLNNENDFKKWCKGKTGYPLVDAGMRELNKTGFMHNRVRMVVGSFLCKHLLIDWRWGEAYFREKLFDYETASNVGNWQWVAGCGVDAAPYFRIFNPHEQLKKFDKHFEYVKKWVPEFESNKYINQIVDHKKARERCLSTYKKALNN
ncbi:MAG: deoxyribodipyrimidine photo-lyase [Flavobacteriaceae bacterium]|nr:deoxyribodipyrimidine photo-lyase [Flavobacteriaceae bacterium]